MATRLSVRSCAAATTAAATVSTFVPSHVRRDGGVFDGRSRAIAPSAPAAAASDAASRIDADVARHHRTCFSDPRWIDQRADDGRVVQSVWLDLLGQLPGQVAPDPGAGDTTDSVRLFDASRLAPCTPVHATSPTA